MPEPRKFHNNLWTEHKSPAKPGGGYAKMFPELKALCLDDTMLLSLANQLANPLTVKDNPNCPAGYTYFGQFIAHDLSFMFKSENRHSAALNLESVYGSCNEDWSDLYEKDEAGDLVFAIGFGGNRQGEVSKELDLPRQVDGTPAIPDLRNDFHTIISQLHLAFMLLHNRTVRELRNAFPRKSSKEIFSEARQKVCWLYQWLVVNDFLRRLCDQKVMDLIWPDDNVANPLVLSDISQFDHRIPYEFALAGYRFGHSMVRPAYRLNNVLPQRPIFHRQGEAHWHADIRGHRKLLVRWSVQWDLFLGNGNPELQYSCRLSPTIAPSLSQLPPFTISEDEELLAAVNLAERTLRSGNGLLPSGQDVARVVLGEIFPRHGLSSSGVLDSEGADSLWYYVLKEAAEVGKGCHLGPVGSWIVASTIFNVLIKDASSFVHVKGWQPDLPFEGDQFEFIDLIRYSGLPVTCVDWETYVEGRAAVPKI